MTSWFVDDLTKNILLSNASFIVEVVIRRKFGNSSIDFAGAWIGLRRCKTKLRKNSKIFPCLAFLLFVVDEMFIKVPLFQETSPTLKNSWLRPCIDAWRCPLSPVYFSCLNQTETIKVNEQNNKWHFLFLSYVCFTDKDTLSPSIEL